MPEARGQLAQGEEEPQLASPSGAGTIPWAYSALRPRLWKLDARAVFPLLAWLLHWSWWTLGVALAGVLILAIMDWTGLPPETCLGRARCFLLGDLRPLIEPGILRRRAHW
ncbi:MAG: IcmT/TraK family protein [Deltaproteobacteria bacterium]|jgi:intracellular multiplication protein IcmT|nr:IcmT/TraK family protein [Deltaproteobacteria bacterium]